MILVFHLSVEDQIFAFSYEPNCFYMNFASRSFAAQGAGHTYSTLPRPRTETKTLSDYEREIHGLRSAMETLQVSNVPIFI